MCSLSLDGKQRICPICGQIESYESMGAWGLAEGLKVSQVRLQAVKRGDAELKKLQEKKHVKPSAQRNSP